MCDARLPASKELGGAPLETSGCNAHPEITVLCGYRMVDVSQLLSGFPPMSEAALDFPELNLLGCNCTYNSQDVISFRKGNLSACKALRLCTLAHMFK